MTKKGTCDQLCHRFCSYYKAGTNEELRCGGYSVVERLLGQGRPITFDRPRMAAIVAGGGELVTRVCSVCDFRMDGCDFILDGKSPPCGGILLLAQLLADGIITAEDLG